MYVGGIRGRRCRPPSPALVALTEPFAMGSTPMAVLPLPLKHDHMTIYGYNA